MDHEGWFNTLVGIELLDPCVGKISITPFFLRTHGHEEFAEFLIAAGADEKMLSEAVMQTPAFDCDELGPAFP